MLLPILKQVSLKKKFQSGPISYHIHVLHKHYIKILVVCLCVTDVGVAITNLQAVGTKSPHAFTLPAYCHENGRGLYLEIVKAAAGTRSGHSELQATGRILAIKL